MKFTNSLIQPLALLHIFSLILIQFLPPFEADIEIGTLAKFSSEQTELSLPSAFYAAFRFSNAFHLGLSFPHVSANQGKGS